MLYHPQSAKKQILIGTECKQNCKLFGIASEVKSPGNFAEIINGKLLLSIIVSGSKRRPGFTLIEMMVVISLIAIVGAWAIPGLKKAYDSFKITETFDHLDTFRSSFRAFYLIMNEFPTDSDRNYVKAEVAWCLPGSYYTRTLSGNKGYELNVIPYQGTVYDINNWFRSLSVPIEVQQFFITLYGDSIWLQRLRDRYGNAAVYNYGGKDLNFPEIDGVQLNEEPNLRNRFY